MGTRGPKKTPTKVLELRGSWRGKTRPQEPQLPPGMPVRPDYFTPEEQAVWDALVPQLHAMRLIATIDGFTLARYCVVHVRWQKCRTFLLDHGDTYPLRNSKGNAIGVRAHPQLFLLNRLSMELLRIEQEFGMTPSARANFGQSGPGRQGQYGNEDPDKPARFLTLA